jgi:hypothetical protein
LNKLTPGEIRSAVEKIRKRYDRYTHEFHKPRSVRDAFEERYRQALASGVDISTFLMAEISAIEELLKREEDREAAEAQKPVDVPKKDHADKVVEENLKRIEKYPDFPLHKDASVEVRRLLGALHAIEQDQWRTITGALRNTAYSINSVEMLTLDSRLRSLASADKEGVPAFLVGYMTQLRRFPRNYAAMERQEKEYILESAFFLNDLFIILERVKRVYQDLGAGETQALDEALALVWGIITDFRLKEFRRKGREV